MIKILFICYGNICRSTMSQYVMQDLVNKAGLNDQFYIESAATSREEIGNDIHYGTKAKLKEKKIPYTFHAARQMTKKDYETYDYLIGMDCNNISSIKRICGGDPQHKIHRLLSFANVERDIADPWYTGDFEATYQDVMKGCQALLNKLIEDEKTI